MFGLKVYTSFFDIKFFEFLFADVIIFSAFDYVFIRNFSNNIFSVFFHVGLHTFMHRLKIPDGIC